MIKYFYYLIRCMLLGLLLTFAYLFLFPCVQKLLSNLGKFSIDLPLVWLEDFKLLVFGLIFLLPALFVIDFIIRLLNHDNPLNGLKSLYMTLLIRHMLKIDVYLIKQLDEHGQELITRNRSLQAYMFAVRHMTIIIKRDTLKLTIRRPINAEAQTMLRDKLDLVQSEIAAIASEFVLMAPENTARHYVVRGNK